MLQSALATLTEQIAELCPIEGISLGDRADRQGWRIDFSPEASAEQIAAAEALLDGFDPDATVAEEPSLADRVRSLEDALVAKAVLTRGELGAKRP